VPTEIGPLPSDLWTLLGQTPPAPVPVAGGAQATTEPPAVPSSPAAKGPVAAATPSTVNGPLLAGAPSAETIMRAIAEAERPSPLVSEEVQPRSSQPATEHPQPQPLPSQLPPSPEVSTSAPPSVQREVTTDDTVEVSEAEGGAGVDVDKLARQVYAEVRRRLASEWERGRGRR
jgi:hypothetical protein